MEFHVLELPKLPKELKEDSSDIELWGKFINAERKEEFDMLAENNTYIDSAYQHLQVISQDKEKRMEYEAREKAVRDYNQGILEAKQRGEAQDYPKNKSYLLRRIDDCGRLATAQALLLESSSVMGISATGLVQIIHGGSPHLQGA